MIFFLVILFGNSLGNSRSRSELMCGCVVVAVALDAAQFILVSILSLALSSLAVVLCNAWTFI